MKNLYYFLISSFVFIVTFLQIDINPILNAEVNKKQADNTEVCKISSASLNFKEDIQFQVNQFPIKIISIQEMSNLKGGCSGGGTCENYEHSCEPECTVLYAMKCTGAVGNCLNDDIVPICRCGSTYYFTEGCIAK